MTRRGSKQKKQVDKEPGLLVQLEGATVDEIIIAGEQWVPPAEHQRALSTIDEQATELDQLKKEKPSNGRPRKDAREVKKHLRCPTCWGNQDGPKKSGLGGKAGKRKWVRQVSGPLQKRCYVCDECGTEWVVEVTAEVEDDIEYKRTRVTQVRKRNDGDGYYVAPRSAT